MGLPFNRFTGPDPSQTYNVVPFDRFPVGRNAAFRAGDAHLALQNHALAHKPSEMRVWLGLFARRELMTRGSKQDTR